MSLKEGEATASEPVSATAIEEAGPRQARRHLVTALLGAAGLGVLSAYGKKASSPQIAPDPTPRLPDAPGDSSVGLMGTTVAWVTWIGTTANTTTNVNLRGLAGSSSLRMAVALGFWSEADGGGGIFEWDPAGGTDDGGTVIVPSISGVTGCWRRVYSGPMDVRWFGCKCDGTSDDTDAFARALAALPTGAIGGVGPDRRTLVISGLMAVGNVVGGTPWSGFEINGKSDFSIVGLNDGCGLLVTVAPTQQVFGTNAPVPLMLTHCSRVQIRGILIDGSGFTISLLGMGGTSDSLVADCVFRNTWHHTGINDVYSGVVSMNASKNIYRGNRIDSCTNGFSLGNPGGTAGLPENDVLITENVITNCTDSAIFYHGSNAVLSNNVITANNIGVNLFWGEDTNHTVHDVSHVTISGNVFTGNSGYAVRVDHDSTVAANHDWLIANNLIDNNLGDPTGASGWVHVESVTNLTITGNTIKNNGASVSFAGIFAGLCDNVNISNNIIGDDRESPVQGPAIRMSNDMNGIVISRNTIYNPGYTDPQYGIHSIGIYLQSGGTGVVIQNVVITGNSIKDCAGNGIWLIGCDRSSVSGNQLVNETVHSGSCGIAFQSSSALTVTGNIFHNWDYAAAFGASGKINLAGNYFEGNNHDIYAASMSPSGEVIHSNGDAYNDDPSVSSCVTAIVSSDGTHKRLRAATPPASGSVYWNVGDIAYNTAPASGSYIGWVCTVAGTTPTWKGFGAIV